MLGAPDGPGSYVLDETTTPEPGPGEVRVALRASALNHLDLWVARGMPAPPSFPHVSGADGAGVVDAIGDGVDDVALGDEVVIDPRRRAESARRATAGTCRSAGASASSVSIGGARTPTP